MSENEKVGYENTWGRLDANTQAVLIGIVKQKLLPLGFNDVDRAALRIARRRVEMTINVYNRFQTKPKSPQAWAAHLLERFNRFDIDERLKNIVAFVGKNEGTTLTMDDLPLERLVDMKSENVLQHLSLIAKLIKRGRWVFTGNGGAESGREISFILTHSQTYELLTNSSATIHTYAILADYSGISPGSLISRKNIKLKQSQVFLHALLTLEWDKYKDWAMEAGIEKPQGITIEKARADLAPLTEMRDSFQARAGSVTIRRSHIKQKPAAAAKPIPPKPPQPPMRRQSPDEIKSLAQKFAARRAQQTLTPTRN